MDVNSGEGNIREEVRVWRERALKLQAEIERLNKRHDDFLQEFWATNARNAKLQAVVDAVKFHKHIMPYSVMKALATLEEKVNE